jgi:MSHA biogenesis protein MshJ
MNAFWLRQSRRIDALTLRERAIMFVSLACALIAAVDAIALSPSMAEQKLLVAQSRQKAAEMDALRARLAKADQAPDTPQARLARQLQESQVRLAALDAEIARRSTTGDAGARLPALLERMLARHEGLTLIRLAIAAPAPAPPAGNAPPWRGVDLGVRGSYHDLVRFVADTESSMPGLRWGELRMSSRSSSTELAAKVYLLGDPP